MATKLYKDGDRMGIWTDAAGERDFLDEVSRLWDSLIASGWCCELHVAGEEVHLACDWAFQFGLWLPQVVEICCKLRGYKSNVEEKRVLFTGNMIPSDFLCEADSRGILLNRTRIPDLSVDSVKERGI